MVAILTTISQEKLKANLKTSLKEAYRTKRPALTHINADTSWLLSLPYPETVSPPHGRCLYNILIDPWLRGAQADVASWFSSQTHVIESSVQTIAELDSILAEIEDGLLQRDSNKSPTRIDLVAISHEFTDHCHEDTLREVNAQVPVFSTGKAIDLIKSWRHFESVNNSASFTKGIDWHTTSTSRLPSWLGVSRLITAGNALYYHSAIVFCIEKPDSNGAAEAIIYTPHGVKSETFVAVATADPPVETLAFMHGLHDVSITITKQLNLGAHNALKAQKLLKARYWVGTHDEVKKGTGLIGPLLRRKPHTIEDALKEATKSGPIGSSPMTVKDVSWLDLQNGDSLVLL